MPVAWAGLREFTAGVNALWYRPGSGHFPEDKQMESHHPTSLGELRVPMCVRAAELLCS